MIPPRTEDTASHITMTVITGGTALKNLIATL
jgi:hypothetical protein